MRNMADYSNPEFFQNITFGSGLHRSAGQLAIFNTFLSKC